MAVTGFLQVSCLAVYENLTQMAVGFEDGSVVVYKGDVTRDRWADHFFFIHLFLFRKM